MNKSYHTCERAVSHMWTSNVAQMSKLFYRYKAVTSSHRYERVTSSDGTHTSETRQRHERVTSHKWATRFNTWTHEQLVLTHERVVWHILTSDMSCDILSYVTNSSFIWHELLLLLTSDMSCDILSYVTNSSFIWHELLLLLTSDMSCDILSSDKWCDA